MKSLIFVMTVVSFAVCSGAFGQTSQPSEMTTRVYDVRDMLMTIPQFPFTGTIGMPRDTAEMNAAAAVKAARTGSLFGGGSRTQDGEDKEDGLRIKQMTDLIKETIEPTTWRDAGGTIGAIRELSGQLVVTHTPAVQQQVAALLTNLRSTANLVRVQADWVLLTPAQAAELLTPAAKAANAPKLIDRTLLAKVVGDAAHYRAEISCFSGQTVSISSGRARTVIYDGEPVVAQNAVAVNPEVKQATSGVMLEVAPLVIDGGEAVVQVRSAYSEWTAPTKGEMTYSSTQPGGSNVQGPTSIDRLNVLRQELASVVRIPLDQAILVGGMTLEPSMNEAQGSQLYLVLQVSASR